MSKNSISTTCSILRVYGPDPIVVDRFCTALLQYFQAGNVGNDPTNEDHTKSNTSTSSSNNDGVPTSACISLTNRYFTAVVMLESRLDAITNTDGSALTAQKKEDGVILIMEEQQQQQQQQHTSSTEFSSSPSPTFDSLVTLHETAERHEKAGDLLRLCIAVTGNNNDATTVTTESSASYQKDTEQEYSKRILWCLDHGYEYVDRVDLSASGINRGHDERDKEGFARIVEAMHTTVWSSAIMHPKKRQELTSSYAEAKDSASTSGANTVSTSPDHNDYIPPHPSLLSETIVASDQEREESARRALLLEATEGEHNNTGGDENRPQALAVEEAGTEAQRQQERYFDNFESALREASRLREMSRSGELSDDDRRKRAGDAAVLLMDLMGKMGGGGFDESESEPEEAVVHTDEEEELPGGTDVT